MSSKINYGPNDTWYIKTEICFATDALRRAMILWSEGHYPHFNARIIPDTHPLVKALAELREYDREVSELSGREHNPADFLPYVPPLENQHRQDSRWGGLSGKVKAGGEIVRPV